MDIKINFLKQNGFDYETALNYMGDFDTFNEILIDFYNGIDNQLSELENVKNASDMSNYAILVHALKSNCRSLGYTRYAEVAYQHELKSKEGDIEFVNANFNQLISEKNIFKDIVSKYLNM